MTLPPHVKVVLSTVYCNSLTGVSNGLASLAEKLSLEPAYIKEICDQLVGQGLLAKRDEDHTLTKMGRAGLTVVLTGGVYDIIHPGHIHTLTESKRRGDVLVVSIARNSTVLKTKRREVIHDEAERQRMVSSLRCVGAALLGSEKDIYETVELVKPDIITLGYDQKHDAEAVAEESRRRGLPVEVVRLGSPMPHIKSSTIIKNADVTREI